MGIREEIEGLEAHWYWCKGPVAEIREVFLKKGDVLAILDKSLQDPEGWELVAEETSTSTHYLDDFIGELLAQAPFVRVQPGDTIAIYRKRPQGDSKEKEE